MIGDIVAGILLIGFFGYVVFAIGKKRGKTEGYFADENDNELPDWAEKPFVKKKKKDCKDCE